VRLLLDRTIHRCYSKPHRNGGDGFYGTPEPQHNWQVSVSA
jgi:hypothetical protein